MSKFCRIFCWNQISFRQAIFSGLHYWLNPNNIEQSILSSSWQLSVSIPACSFPWYSRQPSPYCIWTTPKALFVVKWEETRQIVWHFIIEVIIQNRKHRMIPKNWLTQRRPFTSSFCSIQIFLYCSGHVSLKSLLHYKFKNIIFPTCKNSWYTN